MDDEAQGLLNGHPRVSPDRKIYVISHQLERTSICD